jgi:acyl-CoA synthetase (AMP-forming)/AMP-acid ligase II
LQGEDNSALNGRIVGGAAKMAAMTMIEPNPAEFRDVHELLRAHAARTPDKVFLDAIEQGATLTWDALYRLSNRVARFLSARGIGANDRVAVLGENSLETLALYFTILRHGATFCIVNVEINATDIGDLLGRLDPKLVLWDATLDRSALGDGGSCDWIPFETLDASSGFFAMLGDDDAPDVPCLAGPDDVAVITFTSGTAGAPKGAMHCQGNYFWIAEQSIGQWGLNEADRVLEYRSLSWASVHMLSVMPCLVTGATLLLARRFSRGRFFDWVHEARPTVAIGIPAVVNMLLERIDADQAPDFSSLRFMTCSTAPLMVEQHRRFEDTYGIRLVQIYGMSEGGVVAANRHDDRRIGSVGRPGLYQNLAIVDDAGRALPPGETGEIEIGGAQNAFGYLLEGGVVERVRGRRLKTGDLGFLDDDGYLHVTGRAKEVIIRGGVNITPLEIDNVLIAHPDIAEAATIGVPGGVYGEEVVSYAAPRPGCAPEPDAVLAHCAAALPVIKRPTRVVLIAEIPKNQRGKIDRDALAERWRRTDSATHAPPDATDP